jgi:hypothetical protein
MVLTKEKAEILSGVLSSDTARGATLLTLEPSEALTQINALGNDFTLDEINEYGSVLRAVGQGGELSVDALDEVAGGVIATVVLTAIVAASSLISYNISKNAPW